MSEFDREELSQQLLKDYLEIQEKELENEERQNFKWRIITPVVVLFIVCFVAYGWYMDKFAISKDGTEVPLMKADHEPIRIKPDDRGGMYVANQDKKVFDTISNEEDDDNPAVTKLMPTPEEPISREKILNPNDDLATLIDRVDKFETPTLNKTATKPAEEKSTEEAKVEEIDNTKTAEAQPVETAPTETSAANADAATPEANNQKIIAKEELASSDIALGEEPNEEDVDNPTVSEPVAKEPVMTDKEINQVTDLVNQAKEEIATPPTPAPAPVIADTIEGAKKELTADDLTNVKNDAKAPIPQEPSKTINGFKVQLGSFQVEGDVEIEWKKIQAKFPSLTEGLSYISERADLGSKGIYYRLKVGPFKTEKDARDLCAKFNEKQQGCIFVKK